MILGRVRAAATLVSGSAGVGGVQVGRVGSGRVGELEQRVADLGGGGRQGRVKITDRYDYHFKVT
jgi:hypothetical protein